MRVAHGCDADGDSHGGGIRGTLQLPPPVAEEMGFDFDSIALQVKDPGPDSSPTLTGLLALAAA